MLPATFIWNWIVPPGTTDATGVSGPRPQLDTTRAASKADAMRAGANRERRDCAGIILSALRCVDRVSDPRGLGISENKYRAVGLRRAGAPVLAVVGVVLEGRAGLGNSFGHDS